MDHTTREIIEAATQGVVCATQRYLAAADYAKAPIASRSYAQYVQAAFELRRSKALLERALSGRGRSAQIENCLFGPDRSRRTSAGVTT